MERIRHFRYQVRQALVDAGIALSLIHGFIESQAEAFREVTLLNKAGISVETYIKNEIIYTQVSMLKDLIDVDGEEAIRWGDVIEAFGIGDEDRRKLNAVITSVGLSPGIIKEFLGSQLEVYRELVGYNARHLSIDERRKSEAVVIHVSLLIQALE